MRPASRHSDPSQQPLPAAAAAAAATKFNAYRQLEVDNKPVGECLRSASDIHTYIQTEIAHENESEALVQDD